MTDERAASRPAPAASPNRPMPAAKKKKKSDALALAQPAVSDPAGSPRGNAHGGCLRTRADFAARMGPLSERAPVLLRAGVGRDAHERVLDVFSRWYMDASRR